MNRSAIATVCVILSSCAHGSGRESRPLDVFDNPSAYLNQQVTACGFLTLAGEDQNIRRDSSRRRSIIHGRELGVRIERFEPGLNIRNEFMCVTGVLVRTGCGDENICSWSNVSHAISLPDADALPRAARPRR